MEQQQLFYFGEDNQDNSLFRGKKFVVKKCQQTMQNKWSHSHCLDKLLSFSLFICKRKVEKEAHTWTDVTKLV